MRPDSPSIRMALTLDERAVLDKCLRCHHMTASPLGGEVPTLECHAPAWHCHVQGQKSKLRAIYLKMIEEEHEKGHSRHS